MNHPSFAAATSQFQAVVLKTCFRIKPDKINSTGLVPINMRVSLNGKGTDVSTYVRIEPAKWDKARQCIIGKGKATDMLNEQLRLQEAHARELVNMMKAHGRKVTVRSFRLAMQSGFVPESPCFIELCEKQYELHYGSSTNPASKEAMRYTLNRLITWNGKGEKLPLEEFSAARAIEFSLWLKNVRKLKASSIRNTIGNLTTLFNKAVQAGLVAEFSNPFARLPREKRQAVRRIRLSQEQFAAFRDAELSGQAALARDVYVAQYYLQGSRIGAVLQLRWADVTEDTIGLQPEKGGKFKRIRITPELRRVLDRQKAGKVVEPEMLIFPFLHPTFHYLTPEEKFADRHRGISRVDYHLAVAGKVIDMPGLHSHTARHTLAMHAAEIAGIRVAQTMLGHTDVRQTEIYVGQMRDTVLEAAQDSIYGAAGLVAPEPEPPTPAPGFEPAQDGECRVLQFRFGA